MTHFLHYYLLPTSSTKAIFFKANTFYFPLLLTKCQKKFNHPPASESHKE